MVRGRLFTKYRAKARERRAQISMKRRRAKQMQMKSIAEKGKGIKFNIYFFKTEKIVDGCFLEMI